MDALTPDELGRLRVPLASLQGLDSTGLHLWAGDRHVTCVYDSVTPYFHTDEHATVLVVRGDEDTRVEQAPRDEGWAIDLAEEAALDRVARWKARQVELDLTCGVLWHRGYAHDGEAGWVLFVSDGESSLEHWFSCEDESSPLYGLDFDDDRRLRDGSRYVDRLALALLAQHQAGVSP